MNEPTASLLIGITGSGKTHLARAFVTKGLAGLNADAHIYHWAHLHDRTLVAGGAHPGPEDDPTIVLAAVA